MQSDADPSGDAPPAIRVVIVDDEAMIRSGFELILETAPDIEVVGTADGVHAIGLLIETRPDVVLLDIRMPGTSGIEVLKATRTMPSSPAVAMMTTFDSDEHISAAMSFGAAGFLVKDTDPADLADHIRTLAAGGIVLSPQVSKTIINGYVGNPADATALGLVAGLTVREKSVLRLLSQGKSNNEIGTTLHLSVGTIKAHVSSILDKLQVPTRVEAALIAERAGLNRPL